MHGTYLRFAVDECIISGHYVRGTVVCIFESVSRIEQANVLRCAKYLEVG